MENCLLKIVKVVRFMEDTSYRGRTHVQSFMNQTGVVVDCSDSHGLCYGVVFPNKMGHAGREKTLNIYWFEPEEIQFMEV